MARFRPTLSASAIRLALAAAFAATAAPALAQERTYAVTPIAVTGEPAPGTGGLDFEWVDLQYPYLSDAGVLAFIGSPTGVDYYSSDHAVWVGEPGNLTLAMRTGDPAPGGAAAAFDMFASVQLNEVGGLAVRAYTTAIPGEGIWIQDAGGLQPLAKTDDVAPGSGGRLFSFFWPGSFDDLGVSSFYAETTLADGSYEYETGIWTGTPSNLEPVVMTNDLAPGSGGAAFSFVFGPMSSNADSMTFLGMTGDPNLGGPTGIWTAGPAGLNLVALQGTTAPGTGGRNFLEFAGGASAGPVTGPSDLYPYEIFGPIVNAVGDVAVGGYIDPIDPLSAYADSGIWVQDAGGLRLIALAGDHAPGTAALPFTGFNHLDFNTQGQMAFDAGLDTLETSGDRGIWLGLPDSLSLLVREGDPAPGAAGETFGNLIMGADLNDAGEVVFFARLSDSNSDGIWAGAPADLALVVREGEAIEIKSGDYRTIQSIEPFNGGLDVFDVAKRFNNAGQLVFAATFTDGSQGLILASPVSTAPNQPPVASAGPDLTITEGQTIILNGSGSTDPDGTILTFRWRIGGVEVGTGPTPAIGPFSVGQHTVTLTVTDRNGAGVSDDMILTVTPNQPPVANAGPDRTATVLDTVILNSTGSADPNGGTLTYSWSSGGYVFSRAIHATLDALTLGFIAGGVPGTYTITLTVTDEGGATGSDDMLLTLVNAPPVANAGPDQTANYGPTVALDGTGSSDPEGGPLTYAWSLDGVQIATGASPNVGPFTVGTHTIMLTVTDDKGASSSDTMILTTKNDPPVVRARVPGFIMSLVTTELDGTGSLDPEGDPLDYVWSIDGVQIGIGPRPVVGPFDVGTYLVTLTVTDAHGLSASMTSEMWVLNRSPVADSGADQTANYAETVTLNGTASYDPEGGPLSYSWIIHSGGGQIGTGPTPTVGPFPVGYHAISVTVTDEHGFSDNGWPIILTVVNESPVANAGPDRTVNYARTVTLNGADSLDPEGGVLAYTWTLNGVQIATGANPAVGPFDIGSHTITLTAVDEHGATATDSMVIAVVNEAPVANAGPDQTVGITKGKTVLATLDGSASTDPENGALSYLWTRNGLTIGTGPAIQAALSRGTHTIALAVTDEHGATASDSAVVTVRKGGST